MSCSLPPDHPRKREGVYATIACDAVGRFRLSKREHQVLVMLLEGRSRPAMAAALGLSVTTIKWHLHNLYGKLEVEHSEAALRKVLFLDDPRWLSDPLRQRSALERLLAATDKVVQLGKGDRHRRLDEAIAELEHELVAVRRDVALEPNDRWEQIALPLESKS